MSGARRILIVEDEARIAEVVAQYLERDGRHVTWASCGREALIEFARQRPDLVVLDLGLPDIPGEALCARFRDESDVPIIMLTARGREEDLLHGLECGADDYLTKPFSPRELTARVRALLRRAHTEHLPQSDLLRRAGGRLIVDNVRRRTTLDGEDVDLTESEFRLLQTLARFPGRVYTRYELIDKVQGYQFEGYERTIDAHVKNLRRKLNEDARRPRLIVTVYGRGYTFAEDQR